MSRHDIKDEEIFSVTELTQAVRFIVEDEFRSIWVAGEISNYRVPASGHAYFVLKDLNSQIKCVFFRGQQSGLAFVPEDGREVVLHGKMGVYETRGEYQIVVDTMEPKGVGALQIAFEKLKEKLFKEGLFDEERKKPLPLFPEKIGVVTSSTGAAIRDILNVLARRFPSTAVLIYPAKVQGEGAALEIAEGIDYMNSQQGIDLLIVGRGGGSTEDLWAFNEEVVARAIYRSVLPVVSAVGHEIDFTIADFVADIRAPTPSAAAEIIVPDREEVKQKIEIDTKRLFQAMQNTIYRKRETLTALAKRRVLTDPLTVVRNMQQRVDEYQLRVFRSMNSRLRLEKEGFSGLRKRLVSFNLIDRIGQSRKILLELTKRLNHSERNRVHAEREYLSGLAGRLNALSPLGVLQRGYSICKTIQGKKIVRDASCVSDGDHLQLILSKGELECEVVRRRLKDGKKSND